jgi:hypothetical protein
MLNPPVSVTVIGLSELLSQTIACIGGRWWSARTKARCGLGNRLITIGLVQKVGVIRTFKHGLHTAIVQFANKQPYFACSMLSGFSKPDCGFPLGSWRIWGLAGTDAHRTAVQLRSSFVRGSAPVRRSWFVISILPFTIAVCSTVSYILFRSGCDYGLEERISSVPVFGINGSAVFD